MKFIPYIDVADVSTITTAQCYFPIYSTDDYDLKIISADSLLDLSKLDTSVTNEYINEYPYLYAEDLSENYTWDSLYELAVSGDTYSAKIGDYMPLTVPDGTLTMRIIDSGSFLYQSNEYYFIEFCSDELLGPYVWNSNGSNNVKTSSGTKYPYYESDIYSYLNETLYTEYADYISDITYLTCKETVLLRRYSSSGTSSGSSYNSSIALYNTGPFCLLSEYEIFGHEVYGSSIENPASSHINAFTRGAHFRRKKALATGDYEYWWTRNVTEDDTSTIAAVSPEGLPTTVAADSEIYFPLNFRIGTSLTEGAV